LMFIKLCIIWALFFKKIPLPHQIVSDHQQWALKRIIRMSSRWTFQLAKEPSTHRPPNAAPNPHVAITSH
jgi:hypothetical protein